MKRLVTILALGTLVAACGPAAPPPPPPFSPAGEYGITINAQGTVLGGTLTIEDSADGLAGTLVTDMGTTPISEIALDDMAMTFSIDVGSLVNFSIVFEGEGFSGEFTSAAFGEGMITGVKR